MINCVLLSLDGDDQKVDFQQESWEVAAHLVPELQVEVARVWLHRLLVCHGHGC